MRKHFGNLVDINDKTYILLPRQLIETYQEVLEYEKGILKYHEKLKGFLKHINNLSDKTITYREARELYYIEYLDKYSLESLESNFKYGNMPYIQDNIDYTPSILDIERTTLNPSSKEAIICTVTKYNKKSKMIKKMTLIYDTRKWKIVVPNLIN